MTHNLGRPVSPSRGSCSNRPRGTSNQCFLKVIVILGILLMNNKLVLIAEELLSSSLDLWLSVVLNRTMECWIALLYRDP